MAIGGPLATTAGDPTPTPDTTPGPDAAVLDDRPEPLPPVPDPALLAQVQAATPDDPYDAAAYLVDLVHEDDPALAGAAVMEILRRAAIPVVSVDGPVVALPDHYVLVDAPVYAEWTADLARDVREGEVWSLTAFVDGLKGIEFLEEDADPALVGAGLGTWGKGPEDPTESVFAGAALRALAGARGELFLPGTDPEITGVDALQGTLVLSHALGDASTRAKPTATRAATRTAPRLRSGVMAQALAQGNGPCDALVQETSGPAAHPFKDVLKDSIKDAIKRQAAESVRDRVGTLIDVGDKALDIVSLLLLLAGTEFELVADKPSTHYKHRRGSRSEHVKLKAKATFDSALAQKNLNCYRLAGIKVPPNGPMAGFKVAWTLGQSLGSYSRFGTGMNPFPLFQQGKHLTVVTKDRNKVCARLSCGETTGADGLSTLEVYPPTELKPGQGVVVDGKVGVTAKLSQDDMPRLIKVTDPKSLIKKGPTSLLAGQGAWAVKRIVDLAISYLKRAGLPNRSVSIQVSYHAKDVYVVKGSGTAFLWLAFAPFTVDLYTCEGLRGGQWKGSATFQADRNFIGDTANRLFRTNLPEQISTQNMNVEKYLDLLNAGGIHHIMLIEPYLEIEFTVTRRPPERSVNVPTPALVPEHLDGPVGTAELYIGQTSLSVAMESFGMGTATFPIVGVKDDPRCPGPGPDDYAFDDL